MLIVSEILREIYRVAKKIAKSDIPVLIIGETGVGKEVLARFIHENSGRSGKFIALNCSAIQDTLIESELFGYRKGSFTDAYKDKDGFIKLANQGTLFLDEISDMSKAMQAKLLRVLETGEFYPIGGLDAEKSNFRLICATNKDLEDMVKDGLFRLDLYERISGATFYIPPLRERMDEIPEFANYFAKELSGKNIKVSPEAIGKFLCYNWPGNLRELKETIRYALAMLDDGDEVIEVKHLPSKFKDSQNPRVNLKDMQKRFKEVLIRYSFDYFGDYRKVMDFWGVSKDTVYRVIRKK